MSKPPSHGLCSTSKRRTGHQMFFSVLGSITTLVVLHQVFAYETLSTSSSNQLARCAASVQRQWPAGFLFFVYGVENSTKTQTFLQQTLNSAKRFKKLNPEVPLGIWTTELTDDVVSVFDFVGHIDREYVVAERQWLTRINFMRCSPFGLTLAVDSQALACSSKISALLNRAWLASPTFDIAVNSKFALGPRRLAASEPSVFEPHNWMVAYRNTSQVRELFREWFFTHAAMERRKSRSDDQRSLYRALRTRRNGIRVGRLTNNFATAFVEDHQGTDKVHRATQELVPGECHVFHYAATSTEEADDICKRCAGGAVRVLVQGHASHFAVALNQAEYDQLTKTSGQTREFAESALPFGADELAYPWRVLQRK
mmetsp:Transcript_7362/g.31392  ORF Transcript_7362/g.31392 Transcript_7362/m.31392 type:complete len:370 (-) Transcript_7362:1380-2489(-)